MVGQGARAHASARAAYARAQAGTGDELRFFSTGQSHYEIKAESIVLQYKNWGGSCFIDRMRGIKILKTVAVCLEIKLT